MKPENHFSFLFLAIISSLSCLSAVEIPQAIENGPFSGYIHSIGSLTQIQCVYRNVSEHSTSPWTDNKHKTPDSCFFVLSIQSGDDHAVRVREHSFAAPPDFKELSEPLHAEIGTSVVKGSILAQSWGPDGISRAIHSSRSKMPWKLDPSSFSPWPNPLIGFITESDIVQVASISGPVGLNALSDAGFLESWAKQADFECAKSQDGIKTWIHHCPPSENEFGNQVVVRWTEVDTKEFAELRGVHLPISIRKFFTYPGQATCVTPSTISYKFIVDAQGKSIPIPADITSEEDISFNANNRAQRMISYYRLELLSVELGSTVDRALLTLDTSSSNLPTQKSPAPGSTQKEF